MSNMVLRDASASKNTVAIYSATTDHCMFLKNVTGPIYSWHQPFKTLIVPGHKRPGATVTLNVMLQKQKERYLENILIFRATFRRDKSLCLPRYALAARSLAFSPCVGFDFVYKNDESLFSACICFNPFDPNSWSFCPP